MNKEVESLIVLVCRLVRMFIWLATIGFAVGGIFFMIFRLSS